MAKTPINQRKIWTPQDLKSMKDLARQNTPTPLIAHKLGRSENAIRAKASDIDLSLKPTNQSPYGTQK
jgi:hypothetical protein